MPAFRVEFFVSWLQIQAFTGVRAVRTRIGLIDRHIDACMFPYMTFEL